MSGKSDKSYLKDNEHCLSPENDKFRMSILKSLHGKKTNEAIEILEHCKMSITFNSSVD